jgi:hypothetical protein
VNEQVTVLADAPTLQTESSDVGTVVGDRQIHELPLALNSTGQSFVRSPETFIFLTPGAVGQGTVGDHGSAGVFETKLSGGQNFGSEILLDGASVQRSDSGTAFDQTAPSVEALTEFKVTTATPTAQYGHTSGGVESFTTKSGTDFTEAFLNCSGTKRWTPIPGITTSSATRSRAIGRMILAGHSAALSGFRNSTTDGTKLSFSSHGSSTETAEDYPTTYRLYPRPLNGTAISLPC